MASEEVIEQAMDTISRELKDGLGNRCESFDSGCLTCAAWRAYDELDSALLQIWDAKRKK